MRLQTYVPSLGVSGAVPEGKIIPMHVFKVFSQVSGDYPATSPVCHILNVLLLLPRLRFLGESSNAVEVDVALREQSAGMGYG